MKRLIGFHTTGGLIASVTAGNMLDNSRFNERPMWGPISKVEKSAREDDDAFAVVLLLWGIDANKSRKLIWASCVLWRPSSKRADFWPCGWMERAQAS